MSNCIAISPIYLAHFKSFLFLTRICASRGLFTTAFSSVCCFISFGFLFSLSFWIKTLFFYLNFLRFFQRFHSSYWEIKIKLSNWQDFFQNKLFAMISLAFSFACSVCLLRLLRSVLC